MDFDLATSSLASSSTKQTLQLLAFLQEAEPVLAGPAPALEVRQPQPRVRKPEISAAWH
jgi:hypothetical protein